MSMTLRLSITMLIQIVINLLNLLILIHSFNLNKQINNNLINLYNNNNVIDIKNEVLSIRNHLYQLKSTNKSMKWSSSLVYAKQVTEKELLLITKQSFPSNNYYDILISNMKDNTINIFDFNFIFSCVVILLTSSIVLPYYHIFPVSIQNIIGLLSIAYPFIYILIGFIYPDIIINTRQWFIDKTSSFNSNDLNKYIDNESLRRERIYYHEAGHILVGYLCGISFNNYIINKDRSSHVQLDLSSDILKISLNNEFTNNKSTEPPTMTLGNLLIVAMSGVIAETLKFGDSKGGLEDYILAISLLNAVKITSTEDRDGYIRWTVGKALGLLRLNRNALDDLVEALKNNYDIMRCYEIIENTTELSITIES